MVTLKGNPVINMINIPHISFDSTYQSIGQSILVIDLRVAVMRLSSIPEQRTSEHIGLQWTNFFNTVCSKINSRGLIVFDDCKDDDGKYWRHYKLPSYKGGRKEKPDCYQEVYSSGLQSIKELGIDYFSHPGFEADDWFGLAFRLQQEFTLCKELIFVTIDHDIMQLVSDSLNIKYYSNGWWNQQSKLKDELEVVNDFRLKLIPICNPYDIVDYKMRYGDKGDNLKPHSPRELIDLRVPPPVNFPSNMVENLVSSMRYPSFKQSHETPLEQMIRLHELKFNSKVKQGGNALGVNISG